MSDSDAVFAMVCCQNGAEAAVKNELANSPWRLAYSRRGFLTLKADRPAAGGPALERSIRFDASRLPRGCFVRTASWSLGLVRGQTAGDNLRQLQQLLAAAGDLAPFDALHLWPRDRVPVGKFDFEPGPDEVTAAVAEVILPPLQAAGLVAAGTVNQLGQRGQRILDVVLVDPASWAIGWHPIAKLGGGRAAAQTPAMWPGGVQPIEPPGPVISRAYYKAAEAIAWSGFDMQPGDLAVEVGAAPGGASGWLIEQGLRVIGIDPADIDPQLLQHERFQHIRARAGDLPRRAFEGAKWLLVDANVRPDQMLATVENIVTHRQCTIRGMILTMKLVDFDHAERIAGWVRRVNGWGAQAVQVRQLARGKREVCLVASLASRG